jgi:uncharacterized membrane protein
MTRALVLAACAWPVVLALAVWGRIGGHHPVSADLIYLVASRICHQRPDRSFQTLGVFWPVCGRCAGLYLAAPVGAVAAYIGRRRWDEERLTRWLIVAALPTLITLVGEWLWRLPVTNEMRALAALPLGAVIAFVIVRMAPGPPATIG